MDRCIQEKAGGTVAVYMLAYLHIDMDGLTLCKHAVHLQSKGCMARSVPQLSMQVPHVQRGCHGAPRLPLQL